MEIRCYQQRAIDFLQTRQRGFIVSAAGSGKSFMAASAVARKAEAFDNVFVLVNTQEQRAQMTEALASVGLPSTVTVTVKCVAARPDVSGADIIVIDEAHHTPAATWWNTVHGSNAIIWGFSATPWTGDWERDGVLKVFFGEENFLTIPRSEVMAGGSITQGVVVIHDLDTPGEFDEAIDARCTIEVEKRFRRCRMTPKEVHAMRVRSLYTIEAVRANAKRNERIVSLARNSVESVLILVSTIAHGELLAAQIPGSLLVHAKLGMKRRAQAMSEFTSGLLKIMIATSLADEGLNIPRASVLILAAGGRSAGKLEQRSGRVMRPFEGKSAGVVHDFADKGASLAASQFLARRRTYKRLGYTIT